MILNTENKTTGEKINRKKSSRYQVYFPLKELALVELIMKLY